MARRFVELFEAHEVQRHQIPRFFGHDLTLGDFADDAALLGMLNEPVLEAACTLFGVRRAWLDGTGEETYVRHDFYKSPENFERFIDGLKAANPDRQLGGYLVVSVDAAAGDRAALILEEAVGTLGDTVICRHHVCDDWVFDYWKSRGYLTACVAIAWKKDVYITGRFAGRRELSILTENRDLPGPCLNGFASRARRWYAEDRALLPEQYLKGITSGTDSFGEMSALALGWTWKTTDGWTQGWERRRGRRSKPGLRSTLCRCRADDGFGPPAVTWPPARPQVKARPDRVHE